MMLPTGLLLALSGAAVRIFAISHETALLRGPGSATNAAMLRGTFLLADFGTMALALGLALTSFATLGVTGLILTILATPLTLLLGDGLPRAFTQQGSGTGRGGLIALLGSLSGGASEDADSAWCRAALASLLAVHPAEDVGEERQMIRRIFDFADVQVKDVMVPLVDVTALRDDSSLAQAVRTVRRQGHSRLPIFHERMPNIVGMMHAFDLLVPGEATRVKDRMKPATYIPDMVLANDVLRRLQREGVNLAVVVDEYGGAVGILTIEDLLEEIVGEIADEYDREADPVRKQEEGRFHVGARAEVKELNERFPWRLPEGDYETLGGLLLHHFEGIPSVGECFAMPYATLRILRTRQRSIEEVEVIEVEPGDTEE
jgi:Mg2+/Co2+ transporter CorB